MMSPDSGIQATEPSGPPRERAAYPHFVDYRTRWMDNDQFGHVNNVVYYSFFDSAVNSTLIEQLDFDPLADPEVFYVAETGCRFFEGVAFPTTLEIGVRIARLGSSSVRYELGVFDQGAELAAAAGHFVHVQVDRDTARPVPLSAALRAGLQRLYAL